MNNEHFSLRRAAMLLRLEVLNGWHSLVAPACIVGGVPILLLLIQFFGGGQGRFDSYGVLGIALPVWCCIAASRAFSPLFRQGRGEEFFLLPASVLEKTVVRLVYVSLLLPLFVIAVVLVSGLVGELLIFVLYGGYFEPLAVLDSGLGSLYVNVTVVQSLFFLGSAWFRKSPFFRTMLTLCAAVLVLTLVAGLVVRTVVTGGGIEGLFTGSWLNFAAGSGGSGLSGLTETLLVVLRWTFRALAPLCWVLVWLRIRKFQSSLAVL